MTLGTHQDGNNTSIQHTTHPSWKYINRAFLATIGIYSDSDLDCLQNHIMFPYGKTIHATLAKWAMEQHISEGSIYEFPR